MESYLRPIVICLLQHNIFPLDIETELQRSLVNPAANSCAEEHLMRVLRRYDVKKDGFLTVEEITTGDIFTTKDGRHFKKVRGFVSVIVVQK